MEWQNNTTTKHLNKQMNKEEQKKALLEKYPLPKELVDQLDMIHYEWANEAIKEGKTHEYILKQVIELEAGI